MTSRLVRFVRPKKFEELTGYSVAAVEAKIKRGVWLAGQEYVRAPDGNILVDLLGFERWASDGRTSAVPRL